MPLNKDIKKVLVIGSGPIFLFCQIYLKNSTKQEGWQDL